MFSILDWVDAPAKRALGIIQSDPVWRRLVSRLPTGGAGASTLGMRKPAKIFQSGGCPRSPRSGGPARPDLQSESVSAVFTPRGRSWGGFHAAAPEFAIWVCFRGPSAHRGVSVAHSRQQARICNSRDPGPVWNLDAPRRPESRWERHLRNKFARAGAGAPGIAIGAPFGAEAP